MSKPTFIELKSQGKLPSIKGVALALLEAVSQEDVSIEKIAQIIAPDPAITARLIKISNSSLYPGSRPIASLADSVTKLGFNIVKQIALSFSLIAENKDGLCKEFIYSEYWAKSIFKGALLRQYCLFLKLGSAEEMFTLGLLSNIGSLALATAYPEKYSDFLMKTAEIKDFNELEYNYFGLTANNLTCDLLDDWKMPLPFSTAIKSLDNKELITNDRLKGLVCLLKNSDKIAKLWIKSIVNEEVFDVEIENDISLLLNEIREIDNFGTISSNIDGLKIAQAASSDAFGWLDSLELLPKLKREMRLKPTLAVPVNDTNLITYHESESIAENFFETLKILVGSGDTQSLKTIGNICAIKSTNLQAIKSKPKLIEEVLDFLPNILFLDFDSSDDFVKKIKTIKETEIGKNIFICLLSKAEQEKDLLSALKNGADSYLLKPFSIAGVLAQLNIAEKIYEILQTNKNQKESVKRYALELEVINKKLTRSILTDPLTNLPNKILFKDRLSQAISQRKDNTVLVSFVSITSIKSINEIHGHTMGDETILKIVNEIKPLLKPTDTLARFEGNEFGLILTENESSDSAKDNLKRIFNKIISNIVIENKKICINSSIGATLIPNDGCSCDEILMNTSSALKNSKLSSVNKIVYFNKKTAITSKFKFSIENELAHAIKNKELFLFFQPRIDVATNKVSGAEALLRWNNPELGAISPDHFIPIAEESGQMIEIGNWVLENALRISKKWVEKDPNFHIAINISAKQLNESNLADIVANFLQKTGFPPKNLELEITESAVMNDIFYTNKILTQIKNMGVSISIDDFGVGYSSFGYLKQLNFDTIKVDKSFILNAQKNKDDNAIAQMIATLAINMNKNLIVEGVETDYLVEFSKKLKAKWLQGFLYSKPIPENEFNKLINHKY